MTDKESDSKRRKVEITLDDLYCCVFQRYTPSAVITLYQEIAQACANKKIDWKELSRRTSTGITNAREYQMLWRHLAYGHPLHEKIEEEAELMDDESDLEIDLEAVPQGSAEDLADAHASVQVLLASGPPCDSRMPNTLAADANLAPNERQNGTTSENVQIAGNGGLHVSSQKQLSQVYKSTDGPDANGSNLPFRKKRNPWTDEEDKELIAAVKKCGEGNWANILRGDFNGERTASQLSQRWAILKRRNKNLGLGGSNINGQQLSQAHLATRNALSVALNMPVTLTSSVAMSSSTVANSITAISPTEAFPSTLSVPQVSEGGALCAPLKNRVMLKKPPVPVKPTISSNSMLQAAAVAAGARIATPEDAESLLKAAQAKNAVHIMHGGGAVIKSGSISPLTPHYSGVGMPGTSLSNSSIAMPVVPKLGLPKSQLAMTQSSATPNTLLEKHPAGPSTEVSTAKQTKATDDEVSMQSSTVPTKLINDSEVADRPKDCHQLNASSTEAEEASHASSLRSEGNNPVSNEIRSSESAEDGK
uniref:Uncharacterized protein n=1 Tax=Kalanchoe fedtschenkoi TaxID=63787 RepID=A0A7N0UWJ5_KALFE